MDISTTTKNQPSLKMKKVPFTLLISSLFFILLLLIYPSYIILCPKKPPVCASVFSSPIPAGYLYSPFIRLPTQTAVNFEFFFYFSLVNQT